MDNTKIRLQNTLNQDNNLKLVDVPCPNKSRPSPWAPCPTSLGWGWGWGSGSGSGSLLESGGCDSGGAAAVYMRSGLG